MSLEDNGGAAHTMALLAGSPAVDAGVSRRLSRDPRDDAPDIGVIEFQLVSGLELWAVKP